MPHPGQLPDVFLDRSLGRIRVPALLREAGLRVVTLAERYGIPADEAVSDEEWLAEAGRRGEVVFMKDARVRYNAAEKATIRRHAVRCFCLSRANLSAEAMATRFLDNLSAIAAACDQPGPFVYAVHQKRIERLRIG